MDSRYTNPRTWFDVYPVKERILKDLHLYFQIQPRPTKDSDVVLVDVGGGTGKDLLRFAEKLFPLWAEILATREMELPMERPRFVLQDLPEVLEKADAQLLAYNNIELLNHDFFYPNPIKGDFPCSLLQGDDC